MSYKKMHIRLFSPFSFFFFSYESCFGNNIVTTSVNLLRLAWVLMGTPSLSSQCRTSFYFFAGIFSLLPLKSK